MEPERDEQPTAGLNRMGRFRRLDKEVATPGLAWLPGSSNAWSGACAIAVQDQFKKRGGPFPDHQKESMMIHI
jgi:hypothetical protein